MIMKMMLAVVTVLMTTMPLAAGRDFDGVDDVLDCGSAGSLDDLKAGGGMSLSAWVFPDTMGEGNNGVLFDKTDGGNVNGWAFRFLNGTTNALRFAHTGAGVLDRVTGNNLIALDSWNHVALTWDGSTTAANVHIYINGAEVTYQTTTNGNTLASDASQNLKIGNNASASRTWDGYVAEAGVWNVVLSASEISALAGGASPAMIRTAAQRVLYLPNWGAASPEADLSGNRNNCAVTGTTAVRHAPIGPMVKQ
jgi:hypothetical protein